MAAEAFHGLAGDVLRAIEPHTEADQAALLVQFLVMMGNAIGRHAHAVAEADYHAMNLFTVLVGDTAKGRKGSSFGHIRALLEMVDSDWAKFHIESGLSSGEGLIWAVRDPIEKMERGERVVSDAGVSDKRLLVVESEFASTLRVLGRDGSTLSPVIRNAWDTGSLGQLVKNAAARATGAHVSIIGHITKAELLRYLTGTEAGNGFGNRFLWIGVRRSKELPDGGGVPQLGHLVPRLHGVLSFAQQAGELGRDDQAAAAWRKVYGALSEGKPGLLGAMTARAEAQVLRLSTLYAVLDESSTVMREHLAAALAVWDYAEASARWVFGDRLGDPTADEILEALAPSLAGLTRNELRDHFSRHRTADQLKRALDSLQSLGLVESRTEETGGRPAERFFARDQR
jgi:hypothetical protein